MRGNLLSTTVCLNKRDTGVDKACEQGKLESRKHLKSHALATLGKNGWLGLIHQGLSPLKKRQDFLGALTL
jgi:hypothetical protein